MSKHIAKYQETMKKKAELEAALANVTNELEELEVKGHEPKLTVETLNNGVLLGITVDAATQHEVFLTSDEVGELVFELMVKAPDTQVLMTPFKRELDGILKAFNL